MGEDGSAFAALGLEPDADSAAIERAYKRLIKQFHPDRAGGDARRAAEINRAYRELRSGRDLKSPLELNVELAGERTSAARSWTAFTLLLIAGIAAALLVLGPFGPAADAVRSPVLKRFAPSRARAAADPMDAPLNIAAIAA